jgi:hypothetical protein
MPLPPLKLMGQKSTSGKRFSLLVESCVFTVKETIALPVLSVASFAVTVYILEVQRPLVVTIPRFIQVGMPLPLLKLMGQSRRGVTQILEAHRPLVMRR